MEDKSGILKRNFVEPLMLEEMSFINRLEKELNNKKIFNLNKNYFKGVKFQIKINVVPKSNNKLKKL